MQVMLQTHETKALDNALKVLLSALDEVKYIQLLRKHPKTSCMRCRIICSSVKVSVITKLEVPELVNISIKY